jgi:hypothetical protein
MHAPFDLAAIVAIQSLYRHNEHIPPDYSLVYSTTSILCQHRSSVVAKELVTPLSPCLLSVLRDVSTSSIGKVDLIGMIV